MLQGAEGAEDMASGLAADANTAAAQLARAQAEAQENAADLQRQLREKEAALASLHKQVPPQQK